MCKVFIELILMDIIKDSPVIRWMARIFIIVVIILIIRWFYKRKKFSYAGIKKYKNSPSLINNFVKHFSRQQQKKRQPRYNKTEEQCRQIIEKIYNKPFPSVRPDFLKSPMTKKNLELDCYNCDLKIALEYNGQQHYTYTPHFHKSKKDFYSQVHRDDWKRKKCQTLGIRLIEIPYWITPENLEGYIRKELQKKNCL